MLSGGPGGKWEPMELNRALETCPVGRPRETPYHHLLTKLANVVTSI